MIKRVKVGSVTVKIFQAKSGYYVVQWSEEGKWKNTKRAKLEAAEACAKEVARRLQNGNADFLSQNFTLQQISIFQRVQQLGISHAELDNVVSRRGAHKSMGVKAAIDAYLEQKLQGRHGREGAYIGPVRSDLRLFQKIVGEESPMDAVTAEHVREFLDSRKDAGAGDRRQKNCFATVRSFFLWAAKAKIISLDSIPTGSMDAPAVKNTGVDIYTPLDYEKILNFAQSHVPKILPWLALGGFAGLRSEEIAPQKSTEKGGLLWENIKWESGVIEVPAEISKTNMRRIAPILPALEFWLKPRTKLSGPVVDARTWRSDWRKFKAELPEKLSLIPNGSRHSYGSYRTAVLKSAGQVALEMGNSESVVKRHYLHHVTEEEASTWWNLGQILVQS